MASDLLACLGRRCFWWGLPPLLCQPLEWLHQLLCLLPRVLALHWDPLALLSALLGPAPVTHWSDGQGHGKQSGQRWIINLVGCEWQLDV